MASKIPFNLPESIKVKVIKKPNVYIAELPDYDVFTEANSLLGLFSNVNDLIYAFFEVPKKFQGKIWYLPSYPPVKKEDFKNIPKDKMSILFNVLITPNLYKYNCFG